MSAGERSCTKYGRCTQEIKHWSECSVNCPEYVDDEITPHDTGKSFSIAEFFGEKVKK